MGKVEYPSDKLSLSKKNKVPQPLNRPSDKLSLRLSKKDLLKKDKEDFYFKNQPLNPSLSYTLPHFVTKVRLEESSADSWQNFKEDPFKKKLWESSSQKINFKMPLPAQKRFLDFFQFLKRFFSIPGQYAVFSQNNFPHSIGTASSASSYSALSRAVFKLAQDRSKDKNLVEDIKTKDLACLSRIGSGSSCRSFFSPWCLWTSQKIQPFKAPWEHLDHQLIIVDQSPKKIPSRAAHIRVKTSPRFKGRAQRAKSRAKLLSSALNNQDWEQCFRISYKEFLDLHSLFETASPPFKYKTPSTQKVLDIVNLFWKNNKDGPLVTMDAGANVHLLYRPDQKEQRQKIKSLLSDYIVLSSL